MSIGGWSLMGLIWLAVILAIGFAVGKRNPGLFGGYL